MRSHLVAVFALLSLLACRSEELPAQSEDYGLQESHLTEGTPAAVGVLAFLNASSTTLSVLDDDVPLDKRAAENLIAFRQGPDGQMGTGDDAAFRTLDEVDRVKWVGPDALARIHNYAAVHGWVPQGDDVLGVYDGVAFTVTEAEATLDLANTATHELLDDVVGLDRRAADGIVAARPLASMLDLEAAYYVGQSAMLDLRTFAVAAPADLANGEECTASSECASGLCVGETLGGFAMCDAASMADNFTYDEADEIPDGDTTGLVIDYDVAGLATVPVDVVVTLDIDHPNKSDLVVALHQPGGGYEVLWNHEANPPSVISAGWGIERDNMVNGTWTIEIIDTVSGDSGELRGFNLYLSSRWD